MVIDVKRWTLNSNLEITRMNKKGITKGYFHTILKSRTRQMALVWAVLMINPWNSPSAGMHPALQHKYSLWLGYSALCCSTNTVVCRKEGAFWICKQTLTEPSQNRKVFQMDNSSNDLCNYLSSPPVLAFGITFVAAPKFEMHHHSIAWFPSVEKSVQICPTSSFLPVSQLQEDSRRRTSLLQYPSKGTFLSPW